MRNVQFSLLFSFAVSSLVLPFASAFTPVVQNHAVHRRQTKTTTTTTTTVPGSPTTTTLHNILGNPVSDLETIALVAGQENYGLAVVLLGEAFWSFGNAPSVDHGIKTLVPASVAAVVLVALSGPMITSGDPSSVSTGLFIATAVSVAMGAAYLARCFASFSPSPKEIPALGVLVAVAGFFSFSQNLVVDGFVTLPNIPLPSIPMPDGFLPELPL